jgi:hypothetical protein
MSVRGKTRTREAFVLMPFDESYDDIYSIGIKEVLEKRGYQCSRADERFFAGQIIDEVETCISQADLIIAEMTDRNANVYYEVGYAHGIGKRLVLLAKDVSRLPFDVRGLQHILYRGRIRTLRERLGKYLDWLHRAYAAVEALREPQRLRPESKAVLLHLYRAGEARPAAECAERASGVFGVLNDLTFLGYVSFSGTLRSDTAVSLTHAGEIAARRLGRRGREAQGS